jgi:acetyl-CoA carboxylase carboxyl transferase subunit beta
MAIFDRPDYSANQGPRTKKRDIPQGLWTKCPSCSEIIYDKELENNLRVCPKCDYHMAISSGIRVVRLCDENTFEELDETMQSVDVLKFTGVTSYPDRLKSYQKKTGMKDAVIAGWGEIAGLRVSLAAMDFNFLGGSMGSVVGEKITRAIERGVEEKKPVVIFCASGGARMYEGLFSLMQMAKTSGALARLAAIGKPYVAVLTNPTMAGVMASYATLGDVILAEPKAMIGFAGARVIRETTQQELPKGFQTAEFLLDRGLIDHIVHRKQMRSTLGKLLKSMGC